MHWAKSWALILGITALLAAALALALGMFGDGVPDDADIATMQAEASKACRCARDHGTRSNAECWAEFNRLRDRFTHSDSATMCMEESVARTCFPGPAGQGERCVQTEWPYGGCDIAESDRLRARAQGRDGCGD